MPDLSLFVLHSISRIHLLGLAPKNTCQKRRFPKDMMTDLGHQKLLFHTCVCVCVFSTIHPLITAVTQELSYKVAAH